MNFQITLDLKSNEKLLIFKLSLSLNFKNQTISYLKSATLHKT